MPIGNKWKSYWCQFWLSFLMLTFKKRLRKIFWPSKTLLARNMMILPVITRQNSLAHSIPKRTKSNNFKLSVISSFKSIFPSIHKIQKLKIFMAGKFYATNLLRHYVKGCFSGSLVRNRALITICRSNSKRVSTPTLYQI